MSEAIASASRYVVERVYFRMYADRILSGQMAVEDLPSKMETAMAEYQKMIDAAEGAAGEAIKQAAHKDHDYIAEFLHATGQADG